jgi:two-component system response regulator (stage 0 sporulation protein F)
MFFKKPTLLIVEDETQVREGLATFFKRRGYEVFETDNEDEAVGLYDTHQPQFVFLDIRLKNSSGIEALKRMRRINTEPKIIMVTAIEEENLIREAKELGADDYIPKPFTVKQLEQFLNAKLSILRLKTKKE